MDMQLMNFLIEEKLIVSNPSLVNNEQSNINGIENF